MQEPERYEAVGGPLDGTSVDVRSSKEIVPLYGEGVGNSLYPVAYGIPVQLSPNKYSRKLAHVYELDCARSELVYVGIESAGER